MPIVPVAPTLTAEGSAVTLALYAQIIGYSECQFFGVNRSTDPAHGCRNIWVKSERDQVAYYLAEAQDEIEQLINYPLSRRWFVEEKKVYTYPYTATRGRIVAGGIRGETDIELDAAVDRTSDPSVVTVATTVTDETEIHVFYPASLGVEGEIEIDPSDIDIAGGVATISIPRCRTVIPSLVDNDREGVDYTVVANFLDVVDVKRIYNDVSTNATLIYPHSCNATGYECCSCGEYTATGCIYVRGSSVGILDVLPATYSGGTWSKASGLCAGTPERMTLYYYAGLQTLTRQARDTIVRLAHSKMPNSPCGCEVAMNLWARDRHIPEVLDRERLNCPFGLSDGAWQAYQFARSMKLVRGHAM